MEVQQQQFVFDRGEQYALVRSAELPKRVRRMLEAMLAIPAAEHDRITINRLAAIAGDSPDTARRAIRDAQALGVLHVQEQFGRRDRQLPSEYTIDWQQLTTLRRSTRRRAPSAQPDATPPRVPPSVRGGNLQARPSKMRPPGGSQNATPSNTVIGNSYSNLQLNTALLEVGEEEVLFREKQILADRLKAAGVDRPDLCIERALSIGYSLERIAYVIDYFTNRKGTGWGGGALFSRLTKSEPSLDIERGWPPVDPRAVAEQHKATRELQRSGVRDDRQQRLAERSATQALKESLEAKHGATLDELLGTDAWAAWELIGKGLWFEANRDFAWRNIAAYRDKMLQAIDAKGGAL